jgi:hypothetical protein
MGDHICVVVHSDGTDNGQLTEIRRIYVQNGQVIQNAFTNVNGRKYLEIATDNRHSVHQLSSNAYIRDLDALITSFVPALYTKPKKT